MQKTFMTHLLYQHSQQAAFDRPNKIDMMIITPGEKISKTDVKVQWLDRDHDKNKHGVVTPGGSVKSETLYWD